MMDSKHVLAASNLLVSSIKTSVGKDMMQIGALDDIRRKLNAQKNVGKNQIKSCVLFPDIHLLFFYFR
jgi:hypothetical protein